MYWLGSGSLVYNPFNADALSILYATIDDLLITYPKLDWIWLWLNEHCMFGVDVQKALTHNSMAEYYNMNEKYYNEPGISESLKFLGVWSQAYIQRGYEYIKKKSPSTRIAISGWGSKVQLPLLLQGLHQTLPTDIVFSCLNPGLGSVEHPQVFTQIALSRKVWAIPWLEGDHSLWHLQPRVKLIREQVKKAAQDNLNGVIAIHWRTEEIRANYETFTHFALQPGDEQSTLEFYKTYCLKNYGQKSVEILVPFLIKLEESEILSNILLAEYYAYTPQFGRMGENQQQTCNEIITSIKQCLDTEQNPERIANLKWLKANFVFAILLDRVGRCLEPAWLLRQDIIINRVKRDLVRFRLQKARAEFERAPIEQMFQVYAAKVRSRGELGVLSSLNQKVWQEYLLLKKYIYEDINK